MKESNSLIEGCKKRVTNYKIRSLRLRDKLRIIDRKLFRYSLKLRRSRLSYKKMK